MSASPFAGADELRIGGKFAQDAFKDSGVVKLLRAVIRQDATEAKRLIDGGVNINALGEGGVTPLLWVFGAHDLKAMKMLLDLGAEPDKYAPGSVGEVGLGPPSWIAAAGGQKTALQLLLDHGANPNLVFGNDSLLMRAVSGKHLDCAELLLQHGADINFSVGPMSALTETMLHVQFGDALWVLRHGYTHDLQKGRRMLASENPRTGQEAMKVQALEIIDRLIEAQKSQK